MKKKQGTALAVKNKNHLRKKRALLNWLTTATQDYYEACQAAADKFREACDFVTDDPVALDFLGKQAIVFHSRAQEARNAYDWSLIELNKLEVEVEMLELPSMGNTPDPLYTPPWVGEGRKSILLVDKEPHVLEALSRMLKQHVNVTVAASAEEALDILECDTFHSIITDYDLGGKNGLALLEYVKQNHPTTVRVLMTDTNPQMTHGAEVVEKLANVVLTKSASLDELLDAIKLKQ